MPDTPMRAVVLRRYGPPDGLRLEDRPVPEPAAGQVLVRVHAAAVNDWDWSLVRGRPWLYRLMYGLTRPRIAVPGIEVAGTVQACGAGAARFAPGDRVYGDLSEAGLGGFAEFVAVSEQALAPMPQGLGFVQAAALPHAAMLALQGLVDVGRLRPGERVLINGAGGGVGMLGVQIAKTQGAHVTGVDAGFKLQAMRAQGFDEVVDYTQHDFTRAGAQYDLILDARSTRAPWQVLRALKPGGRYVTVGGELGPLLSTLALAPMLRAVTGKALRIVSLKPNRDMAWVNRMVERGALACPVDGPYPLADVAQALRRFGEARHVGKVVMTVTD